MIARALALLAVAGCQHLPPPARPIPMADDGRVVTEPLAEAFAVEPAHPVAAYNERVLAPLDPQFDTYARALWSARDVRLDLAADALAHAHARGGTTTHAFAEFLTRSYGVIEPIADMAITHAATDDERIADLKRAFGAELNYGNTRIGFGSASGVVVAILFYTARVELDPFPRSYVGSVDLSGALAPGLDRLAITRWVKGHLPELTTAKLKQGEFRERMPCPHPGMSWLSFDALDKGGAAHVLQLPVTCGEAVPASYIVEPAVNFAGTDRERHIAAIISRERALENLPPLEVLPVVQASAHAYAERKARGVRVSAPPGLGGHAWWSVFHADSYEEAVEQILNAPDERTALERRDFNRVGVGVVPSKDGGVWIALVYVQVPHPIDTGKAAEWLGVEIRKRAKKPFATNERANDLASRVATQLALGWHQEDFYPALQSWANMAKFNWFMAVENVTSLDTLDVDEFVSGRRFGAIGVGVAQSAASGSLTGAIWVVVIYLGYVDTTEAKTADPNPSPFR